MHARTKSKPEKTAKQKAKAAFKHVHRDVFGGANLRNSPQGGTHAKKKRTLEGGAWLHVCMRAARARGERSMLKPKLRQRIEVTIIGFVRSQA